MVLEEQIAQLETTGQIEQEQAIREKLDIGHALPSSDLMIEETRSIEKRKEALENELEKLNQQKQSIEVEVAIQEQKQDLLRNEHSAVNDALTKVTPGAIQVIHDMRASF